MLYYAGDPAEEGKFLNEDQVKHFFAAFPAECCAVCKFWEEDECPTFSLDFKGNPMANYHGICRRHAPIICPDPDDPEGTYQGAWPETRYADWCGDFVVGQQLQD